MKSSKICDNAIREGLIQSKNMDIPTDLHYCDFYHFGTFMFDKYMIAFLSRVNVDTY